MHMVPTTLSGAQPRQPGDQHHTSAAPKHDGLPFPASAIPHPERVPSAAAREEQAKTPPRLLREILPKIPLSRTGIAPSLAHRACPCRPVAPLQGAMKLTSQAGSPSARKAAVLCPSSRVLCTPLGHCKGAVPPKSKRPHSGVGNAPEGLPDPLPAEVLPPVTPTSGRRPACDTSPGRRRRPRVIDSVAFGANDVGMGTRSQPFGPSVRLSWETCLLQATMTYLMCSKAR